MEGGERVVGGEVAGGSGRGRIWDGGEGPRGQMLGDSWWRRNCPVGDFVRLRETIL